MEVKVADPTAKYLVVETVAKSVTTMVALKVVAMASKTIGMKGNMMAAW
jgi:hypothetical protein